MTSGPVVPAPSEAESHPTVLIVDDDRTTRRYLEIALLHTGGYVVEIADTAQGALDILGNTLVDLIVSDITMPDMDGFQLFRRIRRDPRYRGIPFIFLSGDARSATKVDGLEMGIDDYITKPIDVSEFRARIAAVLRRAEASRAAFQARKYNLAGDFTGISFPDLIGLLALGRRTGHLAIITRRSSAALYFSEGDVVEARYANLAGEEAFYQLMTESQGQFEFTPGEAPPGGPSMAVSATSLLMEGARRMDHAGLEEHAGGTPSPRSAPEPTAGGDHGAVATPPDVALAAALQASVSDPFSLGEIRIFDEKALQEWTRPTTARERFHVFLVTDQGAGVSTLMGLAAPVSEEQITEALRRPPQALGLYFHMGQDRLVDVILVDQERPGALAPHLGLRPSVLVLAPPHGDFFSLRIGARADLEALLERLPPVALLGTGNASVEQGLRDLARFAQGPVAPRCLPAGLGDPGFDMRGLLVEAIQLWAAAAPAEGAKAP